MKVDLKYGNVQVNIDFGGFKVNTSKEAIEVMDKVREIVNDYTHWSAKIPDNSIEDAIKEIAKDCNDLLPGKVVNIVPPRRDEFGFRERLPNNVVDVNKLDVQQAVTENALVRCPKCGQAHALVISFAGSMYLLRKHYASNEFIVIHEFESADEDFVQACRLEDESKLDYFYRLQSIPASGSEDFVVENNMEVFCPVCAQSSPFIDWKDAWENPLGFFEYEEVCEACGGELSVCVNKSNKDASQNMLLRECNDCHKRELPKT